MSAKNNSKRKEARQTTELKKRAHSKRLKLCAAVLVGATTIFSRLWPAVSATINDPSHRAVGALLILIYVGCATATLISWAAYFWGDFAILIKQAVISIRRRPVQVLALLFGLMLIFAALLASVALTPHLVMKVREQSDGPEPAIAKGQPPTSIKRTSARMARIDRKVPLPTSVPKKTVQTAIKGAAKETTVRVAVETRATMQIETSTRPGKPESDNQRLKNLNDR